MTQTSMTTAGIDTSKSKLDMLFMAAASVCNWIYSCPGYLYVHAG